MMESQGRSCVEWRYSLSGRGAVFIGFLMYQQEVELPLHGTNADPGGVETR
jgi:hypothetical protein